VTHGENVSLSVERKLVSLGDKSGGLGMGQPGIIGLRRLTATLLTYLDTWIASHRDDMLPVPFYRPTLYVCEPYLCVDLCLLARFAFEFMVVSGVAL